MPLIKATGYYNRAGEATKAVLLQEGAEVTVLRNLPKLMVLVKTDDGTLAEVEQENLE